VLFEKASGDPLVDGISDVLNKFSSSGFVPFFGSLNSLEVELDEAFQRVLIHVLDDAQRDTQEIEHGTFSSDGPIYLSLGVDIDFSLFGDLTLLFDTDGGGLGLVQVGDQIGVVQNGLRVGIGQFFQQTGLKLV